MGGLVVLYWLLKYVLLGPVLRVFCPAKITGEENIPEDGAAIMAGNHLAVVDSFFLPAYCPRKVWYLAKREYFTSPGVKGLLKKWFFTGVGSYPVDRTGGSAGQAAIQTGVRLLKEGKLLGIYPEGTRSPDGKLHKGKTGLARMALEAKVPIVPVAIIGSDKVNPIGSKMWRPARIQIHFGKPIDVSRYDGLAGDRFVERSITDEVMYALMELSGQEYVDVYAAKRKEQLDGRDADRIPSTEAG